MGAEGSVSQLSQETKDILEAVWQDIPTSKTSLISSSYQWNQYPLSRSHAGGWKVIRVFVSSTFTDFHAEREVLVKYIFPKLREWCEQRRIYLVEVDLRWGVPAESTTETILRACLGEIERCIEENSIPFFINMLGQRYGWIPSRDQVPNDLFHEFEWKHGASVTHMEILRAAFRAYNPRALFLFRNSDYIYTLSDEFYSQFVDSSWSAKVSMDLLKHHISSMYGETNQVVDYSISLSGIDLSSGMQKLSFAGLDVFGEKVFKFLQDTIAAAYPVQQEIHNENNYRSEVQVETCQNYFCDQRLSNKFIGRDQVVSKILNYCRGKDDCNFDQIRDNDGVCLSQSDGPLPTVPLFVYSELSGTGLSTILAVATDPTTKLEVPSEIQLSHTLYHSMQAYDDTIVGEEIPIEQEIYLNITRLFFRMILKFGNYSLVDDLFTATEQELSYDIVTALFGKLFSVPSSLRDDISSTSPACLFIDALDTQEYILSHFPAPLPPYLRLVISTHSESLLRNCRERYSWNLATNIVTITPLDSIHISEVITAKMMMYNKRLDSLQLGLLCERSKVTNNNLHWVYMACEEVRMFGAFETVTSYIANLPTNLVDLFQLYLVRIIQAGQIYQAGHMDCLIKDSLLYFLASASGLMETELMDLLALTLSRVKHTEQVTPLQLSDWSNVFIFLRPLLHLTSPDESFFGAKYRPRYAFRSYQVREAVKRYFSTHPPVPRLDETLSPYCRDLITYFSSSNRDSIRQAEELPIQFMQLNDCPSLYEFIRKGRHNCLPWSKRLRFIDFLRCKLISRPFTQVQSSTNQGPPYPERMCCICAMKCTFHPTRINKMSCGICGQPIGSVFWTSNGENTVRLLPTESYLYMCRTHAPKAYLDQKLFKPDCHVCRLPIGAVKQSFCVVICNFCKLAGNRCGYLVH